MADKTRSIPHAAPRRVPAADPPAHHRKRRRAARDPRPVADVDQRRRGARRRAPLDGAIATSPTRRRCLTPAAPTGRPRTHRRTSTPGRGSMTPTNACGVALGELYAFYRRTEAMLENLFRDETTVPLVQERFAAFRGYFEAARDTLMAGGGSAGPPAGARRQPSATRSPSPPGSRWSASRDSPTPTPRAPPRTHSRDGLVDGGVLVSRALRVDQRRGPLRAT